MYILIFKINVFYSLLLYLSTHYLISKITYTYYLKYEELI